MCLLGTQVGDAAKGFGGNVLKLMGVDVSGIVQLCVACIVLIVLAVTFCVSFFLSGCSVWSCRREKLKGVSVV